MIVKCDQSFSFFKEQRNDAVPWREGVLSCSTTMRHYTQPRRRNNVSKLAALLLGLEDHARSPDLTPSDTELFGSLKWYLPGQQFVNYDGDVDFTAT
jgi:hypothetical protein